MKQSNQTKRINLRLFLFAGLLAVLLALSGTQTTRAAGITVNSTADVLADDGQCTLREAITAANTDTASGATPGECVAGSSADTITFAADYTITLGSQLPAVTSAITITGNGQANTIIQANAAAGTATYRVFEVGVAGNLTLDGVTVRHGRCAGVCITITAPNLGGGIYNSGILTVTNSTLSGNHAVEGGGIYNLGIVTLTNSTLSGNTGGTSGGGIVNHGTVALTASTLYSNGTGIVGGGIYNQGLLTVRNSTLSYNYSFSRGGGILNVGTVTVTNSTLFGNTATDLGGGIHNAAGTVTVTNSLFAGSTSGNCRNSATLTADASNIADDASCGSATVKTAADIALGPLGDNGGPTPTMALGPGSAAIDAGNDSYTNAAGLTTDQRGAGFTRISGGAVDVGAFEVQSAPICQPGSYDNGTGCVLADPGFYVPTAGATEQTPCAPGFYQPSSGAVACIAAPAGTYVNVSGAVAAIPCAPGSYQPNTGSLLCLTAEPGHFVLAEGSAAQVACQPGTYQPNSGAILCILAEPGYYVDVSGAVEQIPCPVGYTSEAGATECTLAVDNTAPTITLTTPANGATYLLNQSVIADYACQDEEGGSGLSSCVGTVLDGSAIDTSSVGVKAFTVNTADNAGNPNSAAASYNVVYNFTGFFSPVDMGSTLNVAKAGQTIPLKWRITDANGAPVTSLSGVTVSVSSLACDLGTTEDGIDEYGSGSSGLQYLGDGNYQFNWKTPKSYANSCKTLKLNLGEGAGFEHTALFKFTK